ncbi:unnamed protein product, partial [Ectocarpus sp. 6 AP-2014]
MAWPPFSSARLTPLAARRRFGGREVTGGGFFADNLPLEQPMPTLCRLVKQFFGTCFSLFVSTIDAVVAVSGDAGEGQGEGKSRVVVSFPGQKRERGALGCHPYTNKCLSWKTSKAPYQCSVHLSNAFCAHVSTSSNNSDGRLQHDP